METTKLDRQRIRRALRVLEWAEAAVPAPGEMYIDALSEARYAMMGVKAPSSTRKQTGFKDLGLRDAAG